MNKQYSQLRIDRLLGKWLRANEDLRHVNEGCASTKNRNSQT